MGRVYLVTGGCRSGKSDYALSLAEKLSERRTFLATCPVQDDEMAERVHRHREARRGRGWHTLEEQVDLAGAIRACDGPGVALVDCLSLWVSNLMFGPEQDLSEDELARRCEQVLEACRATETDVVFVTNEVGMGVVPATELGRRYRDLLGRCNQVMAAGSDAVTLLVSGMPVHVKGKETI
jgi:adenosylcobinamide kinase/adenosylcobinamide-phosphate guanylyltransferase